jgi:hypothetical protein
MVGAGLGPARAEQGWEIKPCIQNDLKTDLKISFIELTKRVLSVSI